MYKAPPGMPTTTQSQNTSQQQPQPQQQSKSSTTSTANKSSQSNKMDSHSRLTYEEQKLINSLKTPQPTKQELEERFPMLKGVPTIGDYTEKIAIRPRPLGIEIRNVRCARCGQWGHVSGDRECPMLDQNPNGFILILSFSFILTLSLSLSFVKEHNH
jgi:CBF1 interacting corepressor